MQTTAKIELMMRVVATATFLAVCFNLTVWAVVDKYEGWEWYDTYRKRWMPARTCMLCVAFWLTMLYSLPAALAASIALRNPWWLVLLLVPVLAAAPTLKLAYKK